MVEKHTEALHPHHIKHNDILPTGNRYELADAVKTTAKSSSLKDNLHEFIIRVHNFSTFCTMYAGDECMFIYTAKKVIRN